MDLRYVKKVIKLLSDSDVDEIEIEEEGRRVRVAKSRTVAVAPPVPVTHTVPQAAPGRASEPAAPAQVAAAPQPPPAADNFHPVKSPIVGTFYRAPAPEAAPFVQIGSMVEPGSVLCIVEAMKLMNEIECDVSGKIVKILVENGQPVEYDQALFLVEKS